MSLILVVEPESRYRERIQDALSSEGWQVRAVDGRDAALRAAAAEAPQLVLVSGELGDAKAVLGSFSRRRGGPGAVALVPERLAGRVQAPELDADEVLVKPFTDQELRLMVRRCLTVAREGRAAPGHDGRQLTSEEIFGDVLAEVESAEATPAPTPPAAPPPATRRATTVGDEIDRKLEETLSGLREKERARDREAKARPAEKGTAVEDLLSQRLGGIERPRKARPAEATRRPAATPAPPAVSASSAQPAPPAVPVAPPAPGLSAPPATAARPIGRSRTAEIRLADIEKAAAAEAAAGPKSGAVAAPRKGTGEIDLSRLDELARPRGKGGAARREGTGTGAARAGEEAFRTQRIEVVRPVAPTGPREFGQYTLLERVAVGGMAELWKARMKGVEGFQKTVAIKKILPHLTDSADFVTMFIDEAKLAAQLQHNNIIHIYDLGKIGDDFYIAMEYVEGKDLRSILNAGRAQHAPLPMGLALFIAARLASALDYAHRKRDFDNRELGLVHRDVSPQNVLISYEGDIKLCDFGIVKAVSKASKTQMGALKGKLQYMSPEQAWGKPVDGRSDLYSLGTLLFETLTGQRLFAGDTEISVLEAVRESRVQRPRALDPALPEEVDALVAKALARDPDERFQSAGQMQKEIEKVLYSLHPTPSQADLAAYMHRLFTVEARGGAAAAGVAPAATDEERAALAAHPGAAPAREVAAVAPAAGAGVEEAREKGRGLLVAAIAAALVVAVGLYFWLGRPRPAAETAPAPGAAVVAAPDAGATPAVPGAPETTAAPPAVEAAGTTAAAVPAVDQRVAEELAKREEERKRQFEAERQKLEAEIARAKAADDAKAQAAAQAEAERLAAEQAEAERLAAEQAEKERLAAEQAEKERLAREQAEAQRQAAAAAPAEPEVKVGELVQMGRGVVPPTLASRPQPSYPPIAKRQRVEGVVTVEVLVDENGNVQEARLVQGVARDVGLNEAALAAARTARFTPATKQGVRVKMWFTLKFPFKL
jgi:TonB family protein